MKNSHTFVVHSKRTQLTVNVGQVIKTGAIKLKVYPEKKGDKYSKGCWGCYFNNSPEREERSIPKCTCSAQNNNEGVVIVIKNKIKVTQFTKHDLYCACTGIQSIIYKK